MLQTAKNTIKLFNQQAPLLRKIAKHIQSGPYILPFFSIMCSTRIDTEWPMLPAIQHFIMKPIKRYPKCIRSISNFTVANKTIVGKHQRILDSFGH
ncbi:hypothetical protein D3C73_1150870 [compost metagenome]